ncbi:unnamed protein product [Phytomonas sp. EM1]|nr:unnamed protein product [Phytomonas sp. EM1]|eukprot:CCW62813.1 unnamed protein product [Phytomonas sp. isolate EM1]
MALLLDDEEEYTPLSKVRKIEDQSQSKAFISSPLLGPISTTAILFNKKGGDGIRKMELLMYGSTTVLPTPDTRPDFLPSDTCSATTTSKSVYGKNSCSPPEGDTDWVKRNDVGTEDFIQNQCLTQPRKCLAIDCSDVENDNNSSGIAKHINKSNSITVDFISHSKMAISALSTGERSSRSSLEEPDATLECVSMEKKAYHVERSLCGELAMQNNIHDPRLGCGVPLPMSANEKEKCATSSSLSNTSTCNVAERKSIQKQQLKLSDFFTKMACKGK